MIEDFKSVSGALVYQTLYASGDKGKHVRADGKGGNLKRGYYFRLPFQSYVGPYRTKTEARQAARDERAKA